LRDCLQTQSLFQLTDDFMEITARLHLVPKSCTMKHWCLTLTTLLSFYLSAQAQTKEKLPAKDLYAELLYSKSDMDQLKKTADSLNLQYLACVPNPVYYSLPQTEGIAVTLRNVSRKNKPVLEALMEKGATLQEIRAANVGSIEESAHGLIAYNIVYSHRLKKRVTIIYSGDANRFRTRELDEQITPSDKWTYDTTGSDDQYTFTAWLPDRPFSRMQLTGEYASMIQYVDCMMDTSTSVMLYDEQEAGATNQSMKKLVTYMLLKNPRTAELRDEPSLLYSDVTYLYQDLKTSAKARKLLDDAIKEAIAKRIGDESLEELAAGRYSKDTILLLKRIRQVIGYCSRDNSPQEHARSIAILASQTHQWPVFIRSHLDIMNDRFLRNSDASYGEAMRGTHLRELELLDIPSQRLLLGSVFRVSDVPDGHYLGNISRLGRAFTESAHAADFEKQVQSCMRDNTLDPFNRCLFFMLYTNYCYQQQDETVMSGKIAALKADAANYPEYIRQAISKLE